MTVPLFVGYINRYPVSIHVLIPSVLDAFREASSFVETTTLTSAPLIDVTESLLTVKVAYGNSVGVGVGVGVAVTVGVAVGVGVVLAVLVGVGVAVGVGVGVVFEVGVVLSVAVGPGVSVFSTITNSLLATLLELVLIKYRKAAVTNTIKVAVIAVRALVNLKFIVLFYIEMVYRTIF